MATETYVRSGSKPVATKRPPYRQDKGALLLRGMLEQTKLPVVRYCVSGDEKGKACSLTAYLSVMPCPMQACLVAVGRLRAATSALLSG
eukprot:10088734-Alexandrium_andersonii.AAC.1